VEDDEFNEINGIKNVPTKEINDFSFN